MSARCECKAKAARYWENAHIRGVRLSCEKSPVSRGRLDASRRKLVREHLQRRRQSAGWPGRSSPHAQSSRGRCIWSTHSMPAFMTLSAGIPEQTQACLMPDSHSMFCFHRARSASEPEGVTSQHVPWVEITHRRADLLIRRKPARRREHLDARRRERIVGWEHEHAVVLAAGVVRVGRPSEDVVPRQDVVLARPRDAERRRSGSHRLRPVHTSAFVSEREHCRVLLHELRQPEYISHFATDARACTHSFACHLRGHRCASPTCDEAAATKHKRNRRHTPPVLHDSMQRSSIRCDSASLEVDALRCWLRRAQAAARADHE